ncbi:hypothetical protein BaRGS_00036269 [Batillaria attramentaria]|uniref:Zinc finger PHD-type domain-containing protein n=1 Tax=Batillaria attramentaria TaxID=370345 RepID=A0ABD0JC92_9CAEN
MPNKKLQRKGPRFPCGTCRRETTGDSIYCEVCDCWFHAGCQDISSDEFPQSRDRSKCGNFVCITCRRDPDGDFDYDAGLARLLKAGEKSLRELRKTAHAEALMHGNLTVSWVPLEKVDGVTDPVAAQLLMLCPDQTRRPLWTTGDGSCLFNAISRLYWGEESSALQLRYRTCLIMAENQEAVCSGLANYNDVLKHSPDYAASLSDCARRDGYSSAWTIQALTRVLGRNIVATYPPVNGSDDESVKAKPSHPPAEENAEPASGEQAEDCWQTVKRLRRQPKPKMIFSPSQSTQTAPPKVNQSRRRRMDRSSSTNAKSNTSFRSAASPSVSATSQATTRRDRRPPKAPIKTFQPTKGVGSDSALRRRTQWSPDDPDFVSSPWNSQSPSAALKSMSAVPRHQRRPKASTKTSQSTKGIRSCVGSATSKQQIQWSPDDPDFSVSTGTCKYSRQSSESTPQAPPTVAQICHNTRMDASHSSADRPRSFNCSVPSHSTPNAKGRAGTFDSTVSISTQESFTSVSGLTTELNISDVPDTLPSQSTSNSKARPGSFHSTQESFNTRTTEFNSSDVLVDANGREPDDFAVGGLTGTGKFLEVDDLIKLFMSPEEPPSAIPRGRKDNRIFRVSNALNKERMSDGKTSVFVDDCGAWSGFTSKTIHYLVRGDSLKYMERSKGQYVTIVKKERVAMDPQPDEDQILVLRRTYTTLKSDPEFKRRITCALKYPASMSPVCHDVFVVEYMGTQSSRMAPHGHAKHNSAPYIRTTAAAKRKMEQLIANSNKKPLAVYEEMVLDNSTDAPRDLREVQSAKYNMQKNERDNGTHRNNVADDVQALVNSIASGHKYISKIIHTPRSPPCVILQCEEQLCDIANFCASSAIRPTVLGIDRTFNLGPCYLTLFVYKHMNLVRKTTNDHPIMLGPAYLHWDGSYDTYREFLSHVSGSLDTEIGGTQLAVDSGMVIGSDEEKAISKAIARCFPSSSHVLCTRHIVENCKRFLTEKVGMARPERIAVLEKIFGTSGLSSLETRGDFDLKCLELTNEFRDTCPEFVRYFGNLTEKLFDHVIVPRRTSRWLPVDWTNNITESMNHVIKNRINWTPQKLPDLIDSLHTLVQVQYADARRALRGMGNFMLAPWMFREHAITESQWCRKTACEKEALFKRFLRGQCKQSTVMISTDGRLSIPMPRQTLARKPGQKKRIRATRTVT